MLQIPDSAGDISRGTGFSFEMLGGRALQWDATFVLLPRSAACCFVWVYSSAFRFPSLEILLPEGPFLTTRTLHGGIGTFIHVPPPTR